MKTNGIDVPAPIGLTGEWRDRMAKYARDAAATEQGKSGFFSTQSGVLTFNDQPVPENTMQVVVVAAMHEQTYYPAPYVAGAPRSPDCYAMSLDGANMVPHPEAPFKQSPACSDCRMGTHWEKPVGGGKNKPPPCKPSRRLALMSAASLASPDTVRDAVVGLLRVPVTSVKNYGGFVQTCAARGLPPWACVVEVKLVPDARTQFQILFSFVGMVPQDPALLDALEKRFVQESASIIQPYPRIEAPAPHPQSPLGQAAMAAAQQTQPRKF